MNKDSICVLLSTYNGEKYIKEQLDSVLAQEGVNVSILIRDDGSSDGTVDIIRDYSNRFECVSYYQGENRGPCGSFFDLVKCSDEYRYYAFCDQDDVWEKDKLSSAVRQLENVDIEIPALYCSNLKVVDKTLSFCKLAHHKPFITDNKYKALVDFPAVGCTEVFNLSAAKLISTHLTNDCLMHDSWVFLICMFFGIVIYDHKPHILYRQHDKNVVGANKNKSEQLTDKIHRLMDKTIQPRLQSAKAFYVSFSSELSTADKLKLLKVINYKNSFQEKMNLFFDRSIRSNDLRNDFRYRLLILAGII